MEIFFQSPMNIAWVSRLSEDIGLLVWMTIRTPRSFARLRAASAVGVSTT